MRILPLYVRSLSRIAVPFPFDDRFLHSSDPPLIHGDLKGWWMQDIDEIDLTVS